MSSNEERRSHKRPKTAPGRSSWKDLPEFCDASASVSATTYSSLRLPELKSLWRATTSDRENVIKPEATLVSGGCTTSSRHLRRRTTSHASRKRHRRHNAGNTVEDESGRSRRWRRKRASYLQKKHEKWCSLEDEGSSEVARRGEKHQESVNWTPTHVWHAKRFRMETLWGWSVPMMHTNRGAKAIVRLARERKSLIQDASWEMQPIWLLLPSSSKQVMADVMKRVIPNFCFTLGVLVESMLHHPDSFPLKAIGPIQFLTSENSILPSTSRRDFDSPLFLYLWVHPSIQNEVLSILKRITNSTEFQGPFIHGAGALAYVRLRGPTVVQCLETTLSRKAPTGALQFVDVSDANSFQKIPDGHSISFAIEGDGEKPHQLRLIARKPRGAGHANNSSVCGFDLICYPGRFAADLFVALIVKGGACPFGVVDHAHLCLEATPPIPVFPRDYPDTLAGTGYWSSNGTAHSNIHRSYLEGGVGRLGQLMSSSESEPVDWSNFVDLNAGARVSDVAVVRGEFGRPFVQLIGSGARIATHKQELNSRRNRRRSRARDSELQPPPLSWEEAARHQESCCSLMQSLSLPALVLCDVRLSKKGSMDPGARIVAVDNTDMPIGCVLATSFSAARGCVHGVAVCGAARLLRAVSRVKEDRSLVVVRQVVGQQEARVRVLVVEGRGRRPGTIALIF